MPKVQVDYNGVTRTYNSGSTLATAGKVLASDIVLTPQRETGETIPSGTLTISAAGTVNCTNYASVNVPAATPAFDGGGLSVSGTASATATNANISTINYSGIAITAKGTATPSRASVLYNGAVAGWVSKADNAVALASDSGSATALTNTTYYVNGITVASDKILEITANSGTIQLLQNDGVIDINSHDNMWYGVEVAGQSVLVCDLNGMATVTDSGGNIIYTTKSPAMDTLTAAGTNITLGSRTTTQPSSGAYIKVTGRPKVTSTGGVDDGTTVTGSSSTCYYPVSEVTPAFDGGAITGSGSGTATGTNVTLEDTNNSGIVLTIAPTVSINRASVLYNGAVNGWVNKADDTTALAAVSGQTITVSNGTKYINNLTVPSGKTLTVSSVSGVLNVNGGNANGGVQVKASKEVVVDQYTVTYKTTTTVNGATFYAGDLKVPVYTSSSTKLQFPDPGIFSQASGTTTLTLSGNVTDINGLTIKDVNAPRGSGTASTSYSAVYLAKWNTASSLTTGPKVTISSSTPSGGSAGDIWYQTL